MADITIESSGGGITNESTQPRSLVWVNKNTGYLIGKDSQLDLNYYKTTDGGENWGSAVQLENNATNNLAIWYDKWTDGDSGTLIHVAWIDVTTDDIEYRTIDTSDDSLSSVVTVFSGSSTTGTTGDWTGWCISITKARGGNIYVGGWIDTSGENGFWRSTDGGSSFGSRATVCDGNAVDRIMFMPGSEADNQDIWCFYQDVDANEITLKVYDNSGDSWSESSQIAGMIENSDFFGFDCVERFSDNHVILVLWDRHNAIATPDPALECYDVTDSSTWTQKTNIKSGDSIYGICAILLDQATDNLYVAYQTSTSTGHIKYKSSSDGGTTWGSETDLSVTNDDHRGIYGGTMATTDGGRFQPCWFNDDLNDLITNFDNSIEFAGGTAHTSSLSDSIGLFEAIVSQVDFNKIITDSEGISESLVRTSTFNKTLTDSEGISESLTSTTEYNRSLSDSIGLIESLVTEVIKEVILSDSMGLIENLTSTIGFNRTLSDSEGISENLVSNSIFNKTLTDFEGMSDNLNSVIGYNRSLSETIGLSDSLVLEKLKQIILNDSIGLAESFTYNVEFNKSLSESLGLAENLAKSAVYDRNFEDSIGMSDNLVQGLAFSLTETIGLAENLIIGRGITLSDNLGISEVLIKEVVTKIVDTIGLIESINVDDGSIDPPSPDLKKRLILKLGNELLKLRLGNFDINAKLGNENLNVRTGERTIKIKLGDEILNLKI